MYLYVCLGKLDEGYWRDSGVLGYLTLKCMVFNCSPTFEFGYPHTLVKWILQRVRALLYGIPVIWDTGKGRAIKISHKSGLNQLEGQSSPMEKFMKDRYD